MSLCSYLLPGWFSPADDQPFAYVANQRSSTVSVVNAANNTVAATVPVGASPFGVAITPNGAFAYLAKAGSPTVPVIDTAGNTVVGAGDSRSFCRVAITQVQLYGVCFLYDPLEPLHAWADRWLHFQPEDYRNVQLKLHG